MLFLISYLRLESVGERFGVVSNVLLTSNSAAIVLVCLSVCLLRACLVQNVLAIGSTSSGETRLTTTALASDRVPGTIYNSGDELADINTISAFSSYGPTTDGRIKPEVVAPGDEVRHFLSVCVCLSLCLKCDPERAR